MIFITGATGFVGHHLLAALQQTGGPARCLVRTPEKEERVRALGFETVRGDITDAEGLRHALQGVETVVHLVGIIEEKGGATFEDIHVHGTETLVRKALEAQVRHFLYQSALGADAHSPFAYLRTKGEAEAVVADSGLPYTILRPSLIIGPQDGFTERMKQLLAAGPVIPVPGDGNARFQPLYIDDWVRCFQHCLRPEAPRNQVFEIGGPEQLTYNEILRELMTVLGVSKPMVHLPMGLTRLSLPFMGVVRSLGAALGREIPAVTGELLSLLSVDNICALDSVERAFGFSPSPLAKALRRFLP